MADSDSTAPKGSSAKEPRAGFLSRSGRGRPPVVAEPPVDESIPRSVRVAGAWSWRLLLIGAVIAVAVFLVIQLRLIVVPVLIAVLLASLLVPFVAFLVRHRWPRWLGILAAMLSVFIVIAGLIYLVASQVGRQFKGLRVQSMSSFEQFRSWLIDGPLQLTQSQLDQYLAQAGKSLQSDSQVLVTGFLSFGSTIGHLLTGILLVMFSTLFILIDGKGIWGWVVRLFPRRARPAIDGAGKAGWTTLGSFARIQVLVASMDAVGIGLGAFILGIPLAAPIAVLVFLGSFIPVVGAVLTGAVAVFIALVYNGWFIALIMLGVVLLVQQIEGHVLQPLIMGTAVKVHPLAVVLAVAAGTLLAGIPGALFAVPFAAVCNVMVKYVADGSWRKGPEVSYSAGDTPLWQTVPRPPRRPRA